MVKPAVETEDPFCASNCQGGKNNRTERGERNRPNGEDFVGPPRRQKKHRIVEDRRQGAPSS